MSALDGALELEAVGGGVGCCVADVVDTAVAVDGVSASDCAVPESIEYDCILSAIGLFPIGAAHGEMLLVFKILPTVTSEPLELSFVGIGGCCC